MNKEKQIEEMANVMCKDCGNYGECEFQICDAVIDSAKNIYEAGYRKQSEGVWKFNKDGSGTCSECGMTQKNVWDHDNSQRFCGCCGAKMKGGE